MARKHLHRAGEVVNAFTILGASPGVAGHACWKVRCNACDAERSARGTALRAGSVICQCRIDDRPAPAKSSDMSRVIDDVSDTNSRIDTLLQMVEAAPTMAQFNDLLGSFDALTARSDDMESVTSAQAASVSTLQKQLDALINQALTTPPEILQPAEPVNLAPAEPAKTRTVDEIYEDSLTLARCLLLEHTNLRAFKAAVAEARNAAEDTRDYDVSETRSNEVRELVYDARAWVDVNPAPTSSPTTTARRRLTAGMANCTEMNEGDRIKNFAINMEKACALAASGENKDEYDDRVLIEGNGIGRDTNAARATERRTALNELTSSKKEWK